MQKHLKEFAGGRAWTSENTALRDPSRLFPKLQRPAKVGPKLQRPANVGAIFI
jgi:hypothetical protein